MSQAMPVWTRWWSVLSLGLAAASCSSQTVGTDTRTNWLIACHETAECGDEFACLCGICTTACDDSGVCSAPDVEAARGNRSRDAGNVRTDAGAVAVSNAGATADEGTVNSTSTGDVTPAVTVAEQLSSESSNVADVNRSDLTEVDGTD